MLWDDHRHSDPTVPSSSAYLELVWRWSFNPDKPSRNENKTWTCRPTAEPLEEGLYLCLKCQADTYKDIIHVAYRLSLQRLLQKLPSAKRSSSSTFHSRIPLTTGLNQFWILQQAFTDYYSPHSMLEQFVLDLEFNHRIIYITISYCFFAVSRPVFFLPQENLYWRCNITYFSPTTFSPTTPHFPGNISSWMPHSVRA